jgi:hypothetical protein
MRICSIQRHPTSVYDKLPHRADEIARITQRLIIEAVAVVAPAPLLEEEAATQVTK